MLSSDRHMDGNMKTAFVPHFAFILGGNVVCSTKSLMAQKDLLTAGRAAHLTVFPDPFKINLLCFLATQREFFACWRFFGASSNEKAN